MVDRGREALYSTVVKGWGDFSTNTNHSCQEAKDWESGFEFRNRIAVFMEAKRLEVVVTVAINTYLLLGVRLGSALGYRVGLLDD
jgi:hypothetical protein